MIRKSVLKVIKVGGSILSDRNEFANVALKIRDESHKCKEIIVVISAMKGVTDNLIELSTDQKVTPRSIVEFLECYPSLSELHMDSYELQDMLISNIREGNIDQLITLGERLSALCLNYLLNKLEIKSRFIDPGDIIYYDGSEGPPSYSPGNEADFRIIEKAPVSIVPGFYGRDNEGRIKAFSRGGSDLSAGIVAGYLEASELEFWKDVGAVMTGDPKIVDSPQPILSINRKMLTEMTEIGSRILHPLSLEYVDLDLTRVKIRGIDTNGDATTEVVNDMVNCLSIVVSSSSDKHRICENFQDIEEAGIYVLTDGELEFVNSISYKVWHFFEILGSGLSGKLHQDRGMISFRSSYSECRRIANELHRNLFSGDAR